MAKLSLTTENLVTITKTKDWLEDYDANRFSFDFWNQGKGKALDYN